MIELRQVRIARRGGVKLATRYVSKTLGKALTRAGASPWLLAADGAEFVAERATRALGYVDAIVEQCHRRGLGLAIADRVSVRASRVRSGLSLARPSGAQGSSSDGSADRETTIERGLVRSCQPRSSDLALGERASRRRARPGRQRDALGLGLRCYRLAAARFRNAEGTASCRVSLWIRTRLDVLGALLQDARP